MDIYEWVDEVKKFCGHDIPMILLGNKLDLKGQRAVETAEGEKLGKDLGIEYLETSAKLGSNVNIAFDKIVSLILKKI
jgi:GTPase SAR1 family protein